jgi:hypothetical protein
MVESEFEEAVASMNVQLLANIKPVVFHGLYTDL